MPITLNKRGRLRAPSLGKAVIYDNMNGTLRVRRWPRVTKKTFTREQKRWRDFMRIVNWAWLYADQNERIGYERMAKPGPFLPRDFWTAHQFGRAPMVLHEGRWIFPMTVNLEISLALDAIAQETGDMLVRGPATWQVLEPGPAGHVLTSDGPLKVPVWAPGGGGGGSPWQAPALDDFQLQLGNPDLIVNPAVGGGLAIVAEPEPTGTAMTYLMRTAGSNSGRILIGTQNTNAARRSNNIGLCVMEDNQGKGFRGSLLGASGTNVPRYQVTRLNSLQSFGSELASINWNGTQPNFVELLIDWPTMHVRTGSDPAAMTTIFSTLASSWISAIGLVGVAIERELGVSRAATFQWFHVERDGF